ncbi:hypothetical protein BML2537_11460 [Providencia stuartii]|nr:hypothetical protein BML2537_11460 [Providencia stuartii]
MSATNIGLYFGFISSIQAIKMKKVVIALCALCAFGSIGGIVLAGMNIYTRSTTPIEQSQAQQPSIIPSAGQVQ